MLQGGYTASAPDRGKYDNPTYVVFDPKSK